jgi:hypothetical protein
MNSSQSTPFRDAVSGAAGALCLTLAGLPFDRAKIRLQLASTLGNTTRNPIKVLSQIVAKEGFFSLWRGFAPALSSAVVENVVVFTMFGIIRRFVAPSARDEASLTLREHAVIGGCAGMFSATAICPFEVLKCRLQESAFTSSSNSVLLCAKDIYKRQGIRGFFSGLAPLLARDIPFNTLFFGSYRFYTKVFEPNNNMEVSSLVSFLSGGLAGCTAWIIIFPFDTLKSKLQSGAVGESKLSQSAQSIAVLKAILKQGGISLLYRGCSAAILRAFPANASLFFGFSLVDKLFSRYDSYEIQKYKQQL